MTVMTDTPTDNFGGPTSGSTAAIKTSKQFRNLPTPSAFSQPVVSHPSSRPARAKSQAEEHNYPKRSSYPVVDTRFERESTVMDSYSHQNRSTGGWPGSPVYLQPGFGGGVQAYAAPTNAMTYGVLQQQQQMYTQPHSHTAEDSVSQVPPAHDSKNADQSDEEDKQLCTFFLRTGTCAYGDKCKFKHPTDRPPPQLNSRGYPLRDGELECAHYMKKGWCAFGVTCKFHHPELPMMPYAYQQPTFMQPLPGLVTLPYYMPYAQYNTPVPTSVATGAYPPMAMQFPGHPLTAAVMRPVARVPSNTKGSLNLDKATKALGRMSLKTSEGVQ